MSRRVAHGTLNAIVLLSLACSAAFAVSCRRPASVPATNVAAAPGSIAATGPVAATSPEAAPSAARDKAASPVAMKPSAPKAQAPRPQAAPSLGGHDRHLMQRPFDGIMAGDFELGALDAPRPGLAAALEGLRAGLEAGALPLERFTGEAARIARATYGDGALDGIGDVRLATPESTTGGAYSARFRVFSRGTGTATPSATGLVLLVEAESGEWLIDHFELDVSALARPAAAREPWDPYASSLRR